MIINPQSALVKQEFHSISTSYLNLSLIHIFQAGGVERREIQGAGGRGRLSCGPGKRNWGVHPSFRPGFHLCIHRVYRENERIWAGRKHESDRELLGQCTDWELLGENESGMDRRLIQNAAGGHPGLIWVHLGILQYKEATFNKWLQDASRSIQKIAGERATCCIMAAMVSSP